MTLFLANFLQWTAKNHSHPLACGNGASDDDDDGGESSARRDRNNARARESAANKAQSHDLIIAR